MSESPTKFNEILLNSIDAAISDLLGERVRPSLYSHLAEHYDITREEIPYRLDSLYVALDQIFGFKASRTLERQIAKHLCFAFDMPFRDASEYSLQVCVEEAKKQC